MAWNYSGCIDCIGCIACNDCIGCINCIGCIGCIGCICCIGCVGCIVCFGCVCYTIGSLTVNKQTSYSRVVSGTLDREVSSECPLSEAPWCGVVVAHYTLVSAKHCHKLAGSSSRYQAGTKQAAPITSFPQSSLGVLVPCPALPV